MKTIMKMMIRNDIRQNTKLLKNYGFIFVLLIVIILFSREWLFTVTALVRTNDNYFDYAISGILVVIFFFKKSPMIRINPASIYYLMDTAFLRRMIGIKQAITRFFFMILAAVIMI